MTCISKFKFYMIIFHSDFNKSYRELSLLSIAPFNFPDPIDRGDNFMYEQLN